MSGQPRLSLVARALGQCTNDLVARAASLGIEMSGPNPACPVELIHALAKVATQDSANKADEHSESGLHQLERALFDVKWEESGGRWYLTKDFGLGVLELGVRSTLMVVDAQAHAYALALRAARVSRTLFIGGGPGTGKEGLARACHHASGRSGPFIAINCSAIPPKLAESELFGVAERSVSDVNGRLGAFRAANGGTLFLDEFGELPLDVQPKLLRVLQEFRVKVVGTEMEEPINVFVIAASNQDIAKAVAQRRFRQDLWDRVSLPSVTLPSLSGHPDAILMLAVHFLESERLARRPTCLQNMVFQTMNASWC